MTWWQITLGILLGAIFLALLPVLLRGIAKAALWTFYALVTVFERLVRAVRTPTRKDLLLGVPFALMLLAGAPSAARSAPITVTVSGKITEVQDLNAPPEFEVGAPFTVSYTMDPDYVDGWCYPENLCGYYGDFSASVAVAGTPFAGTDDANVGIRNDEPDDAWVLVVVQNDVVLVFFDRTATRLSSASPFFVSESLEGWTEALLYVERYDAIGTVIPEPTSVALLFPALLGVVAVARLRRSRSCQLDRQR